MSRQRWGTFAVMDHLLPNPFIADVLLFDRLVLPYPPDQQERIRWSQWKPDHLDACLEALGKRAYKVHWDKLQQIAYKEEQASASAALRRMDQLKYVSDPGGMTRMVLVKNVQNQMNELDARPPLVMTAYPSAIRFKNDSGIDPKKLDSGRVKALFSHRFLVPKCAPADELKLLKDLVALSSGKEFADKREMFYQWQEDVVLKENLNAVQAVNEMESLLRELDEITKKATKKRYMKFACLVLDIGADFVPMGHTMEKIGKGTLKVAQFAVDGKEVIARSELGAAAMFHDARKVLGWN
jgi:hypothetical protein